MHKGYVLMLITVLVVSSLMVFTVAPITVYAVSKPSIPQFSVKFIDNSYNVPTSTTTVTDPYTGKETTITNSGYRVEKYDIEVTIKNQPFTPYTNANGYECNLYYDIQVKAHFGENWRSSESYYPFDNIGQSSSKETVITFTLKDDGLWAKPPSGGQLDFRVKAYTGYWRAMPEIGFREPGLFREESSGWSDVQTITITYESSSPSPPSQTVSSPREPHINI